MQAAPPAKPSPADIPSVSGCEREEEPELIQPVLSKTSTKMQRNVMPPASTEKDVEQSTAQLPISLTVTTAADDKIDVTPAAIRETQEGISLDKALAYYQSCDDLEKLNIQICALIVLGVLRMLSFGFTGLLIMSRLLKYHLEVQVATAMTAEKEASTAAAPSEAQEANEGGQVIQKTTRKLQRSAPAGARMQRLVPTGTTPSKPSLSDIGIKVQPVSNGLKIKELKPGTSAADSELIVGDIVIMIDEQFTAGISLSDALSALCGPPMSSIEVTAKRDKKGGFSSKIYASILRDTSHSNVERSGEWKPSMVEIVKKKVLEPLRAVITACRDVITGKPPAKSLLNKVKGLAAITAGQISDKISKRSAQEEAAADMRQARQKTAAKKAELDDYMEEALSDGIITEEESRLIKAKQAELEAAKKEMEQAAAAAIRATAEAELVVAKAKKGWCWCACVCADCCCL